MPMMVCVGCGSFFKIKKNDVSVEELMPLKDGNWSSYKLWMADLYGCERCGVEVIAGFGHGPAAEHFQSGYAEIVQQLRPLVRVDDCSGAFREKITKEEER